MTVEHPTRQLLGIDLIRFFAAFSVMLFHINLIEQFQYFTSWGWVGVEIFFVLSGFVISYTAVNASWFSFLRARIVRLMPCVWVCGSVTALGWLLLVGGEGSLGRRYLDTLILWPVGPWVDPVYWTLPVEISFYSLIFVILAIGAFRYITVVFALLALISTGDVGALLANQFFPSLWIFHWAALVPTLVARLMLLDYGCFFALGGTLWLCCFDGITPLRLVTIAISAVGGVIENAFACRGFSSTAPIMVPELIWAAAVAAIAWAAWNNAAVTRLFGRYSAGIRVLGLSTYPLYLLHDDLGSMLANRLLPQVGPVAAMTLVGLIFIAAAILVAAVVEPMLQRPLRAGVNTLGTWAASLRASIAAR